MTKYILIIVKKKKKKKKKKKNIKEFIIKNGKVCFNQQYNRNCLFQHHNHEQFNKENTC